MSDAKLDINYGKAQAALDTLKTGNDKIQVALDDIGANPFTPLCSINPNIGSNYVKEYSNSLQELLAFAKDHIYAALSSVVNAGATGPTVPTGPTVGISGGGSPWGGGGDTSSNPTGPTGDTGTPINPSGPTGGDVDVTGPTGGLVVPIDPMLSTALENGTLEELDSAINALITLADQSDKPLDELISDPKYADELKKKLLEDPNLPSELKEIIKNIDSEVLRNNLQQILQGKVPSVFEINPLNLGIIYCYLEKVAKENGITVDELLNNEKYSALLKKTLASFENAKDLFKLWDKLPADEYQATLLQFWDGNEVSSEKEDAVEIVRSFVRYISDETGVDAGELLTDSVYADVLKRAGEEFGKTALFAATVSQYSDSGMHSVIGDLFNGKNAAALGMEDNDVAGFKNEIDSLAKSKGVTAEEVLTSSKYADDVRKTLDNSKNAKDVGSIFKNAESSTVQNVARNLYNTATNGSSDSKGETVQVEVVMGAGTDLNSDSNTSTNTDSTSFEQPNTSSDTSLNDSDSSDDTSSSNTDVIFSDGDSDNQSFEDLVSSSDYEEVSNDDLYSDFIFYDADDPNIGFDDSFEE